MGLRQNEKSIVNDVIVKEIIEALGSLKYGHVQITVHNSRVVQIEKTEKVRLDDIWRVENGGGI